MHAHHWDPDHPTRAANSCIFLRLIPTFHTDALCHAACDQVSHIGIQPAILAAAQSDTTPPPLALLQRLNTAREGRKMMVGIDEMERLGGVVLKMIAVEQLLIKHPRIAETLTLVQVGRSLRRAPRHVGSAPAFACEQVGVRMRNFTPSSQQHYEELRAEIIEVVERINARFPGAVIFEELPTMSLRDRMQLWQLADVVIFTPIREGVNTYPFEAVRLSSCSDKSAAPIRVRS